MVGARVWWHTCFETLDGNKTQWMLLQNQTGAVRAHNKTKNGHFFALYTIYRFITVKCKALLCGKRSRGWEKVWLKVDKIIINIKVLITSIIYDIHTRTLHAQTRTHTNVFLTGQEVVLF